MDDNLGQYEFEGEPDVEIDFMMKHKNHFETNMKFVRIISIYSMVVN